MELLYAWINSDDTGYIQQEGFNFSPEYRFMMDIIDDRWSLLEDSSYHKKKNLFRNSVIENVTAVIGMNGVGKTTLLKWLTRMNCMSCADNKELGEKVKEYEEMTHTTLLIFKENDECTIYHNFETNRFKNKTGIKNVRNTLEDVCEKTTCEFSLDNITKVFLTNSSFSPDVLGISKVDKLNSVMLSPSSLSVIGSEFYDNYIKVDKLMKNFLLDNYAFTDWNLILAKSKTIDDFQRICDVLYFGKLIREKKICAYKGKICVDIEIWADLACVLLDKEYKGIHSKKNLNPQNTRKEIYCKLYDGQRELWSKISQIMPYVIRALLCNLIFEICLLLAVSMPKIENIEDCKKWMDTILISGQNKKRIESEDRDFYKDLEEIEQLAKIVNSVEDKNDVCFYNNREMKESTVLSLDCQPEKYKGFLQLVEECFNKENSFILRYIRIGNLGMSSGERAYQNLLSWINLIPQFHKIQRDIPKRLKETILLMIDEIDLYAHPEMQRNFINYFLDEIQSQFRDYKVQIIFTTHSPLCLSDIPVENTIYLTKKNERCVVDQTARSQTFSRDVFRILNDAFYLKDSTMGSYAKKIIDEIFNTIKDYQDNQEKSIEEKEYQEIKEKIEYIGNDLLRYKLNDMLMKCLKDKTRKIEVLRSQREAIGEVIRKLENE